MPFEEQTSIKLEQLLEEQKKKSLTFRFWYAYYSIQCRIKNFFIRIKNKMFK